MSVNLQGHICFLSVSQSYCSVISPDWSLIEFFHSLLMKRHNEKHLCGILLVERTHFSFPFNIIILTGWKFAYNPVLMTRIFVKLNAFAPINSLDILLLTISLIHQRFIENLSNEDIHAKWRKKYFLVVVKIILHGRYHRPFHAHTLDKLQQENMGWMKN